MKVVYLAKWVHTQGDLGMREVVSQCKRVLLVNTGFIHPTLEEDEFFTVFQYIPGMVLVTRSVCAGLVFGYDPINISHYD